MRGADPGGLALCGGVALYLLGQAGFAWRMLGSLPRPRIAVALVLLAVTPVADRLPSWLPAAIVCVLLIGLCIPSRRPPGAQGHGASRAASGSG